MPGGGHEQEEEVEVSVGEEAALVDLVEESLGGAGDHVLRGHPVSVQVILGNLHKENILWRIKNILLVHVLSANLHVGTLATTKGVANGAAGGHGIVEVSTTHQGGFLACKMLNYKN